MGPSQHGLKAKATKSYSDGGKVGLDATGWCFVSGLRANCCAMSMDALGLSFEPNKNFRIF